VTAAPQDAPSWTSGALAQLLRADLIGPADIVLSSLDTLDAATSTSLSFIRSSEYLRKWNDSRAGAALVSRNLRDDNSFQSLNTADRAILLVDDADHALAQLLRAIAIEPARPQGVSPAASIHPTAQVHPSAHIGAFVSIGPGSTIGADTVIHPSVCIGAQVKIGERCEIFPRVVIYDRCVLHNRVILNAGVVIGADGFGYIPTPDKSGHIKIPHIGFVEIHDDVEVGANTCIDRGKFGPTVIGPATKIDNLCQIAHNVRIGRACIICGKSAIAGSVTIGNNVTLAGNVGIADNVTINDGAMAAAWAGVMRDVPAGETWGGNPAQPFTAYMRSSAAFRRLPEMARQLNSLLHKPSNDDNKS